VAHLAVLDVAGGAHHLEPAQIAQGLVGAGDGAVLRSTSSAAPRFVPPAPATSDPGCETP
jgi:hypothetical protein